MDALYLPKQNLYRQLVTSLKKNHILNVLFKKVNVSRHIEIRSIKEHINVKNNSHVLDVGCGDGYWTNCFSKHFTQASGIDPFESDLQIARRYSNIDFRNASAEAIPYANNTFDTVVSVCVFEHLYDDRKAFSEIFRCLKNGGKLLATVDSLSSPGITDDLKRWHKEKCYCKQLYSKEVLTAKLEDAGFKNIETKYIISHPFSTRWELASEKLGIVSFFIYPLIYFPIKFLERNNKREHGYKLFVKATKHQ